MDSGAALWGLARSAGCPGTSAGGLKRIGHAIAQMSFVAQCCMEFALTLPEARLEMRSEIRLLECPEKSASAVEALVHGASMCASSCFALRSCPGCNVFSPGRRRKSPREMERRPRQRHPIRSVLAT